MRALTIVWSGFRISDDMRGGPPVEDGTIMGGVVLSIADCDGNCFSFEEMDEVVEYAAACVDAIERFVRA